MRKRPARPLSFFLHQALRERRICVIRRAAAGVHVAVHTAFDTIHQPVIGWRQVAS
jgi:hypothetical protein